MRETVSVEVVRRDTKKRENVRVKLAAAPSPDADEAPRVAVAERDDPLGISVEPLSDEFRRQYEIPDDISGVVIRGAEERGPLARKVQMRGRLNGQIVQIPWVVRDVNGEKIQSVSDYERAVDELAPGSVASISLYDPVYGSTAFPSIRIPNNR